MQLSTTFVQQQIIIDMGTGLAPNRIQPITDTNDH